MGLSVRLAEAHPEARYVNCGMGTRQNMDVLRDEGFEPPADATPNDLMLAAECDTEDQLKAVFDAGMAALLSGGAILP